MKHEERSTKHEDECKYFGASVRGKSSRQIRCGGGAWAETRQGLDPPRIRHYGVQATPLSMRVRWGLGKRNLPGGAEEGAVDARAHNAK